MVAENRNKKIFADIRALITEDKDIDEIMTYLLTKYELAPTSYNYYKRVVSVLKDADETNKLISNEVDNEAQ